MKTIIAMLSLLTVITASASTISAKALVGIESRIENQKAALSYKLDSANTDDIIEGKIVASITHMVEEKLAKAEKMVNSINESDLTAAKVAEINAVLDESETLIQEI